MAHAVKLVCIALDTERNIITGESFFVNVIDAAGTPVSELKQTIFERLPSDDRPYHFHRIRLWKPKTPIPNPRTRVAKLNFHQTLKDIAFPDPESSSAFGAEEWQLMDAAEAVSNFWSVSPPIGSFHLVAEVLADDTHHGPSRTKRPLAANDAGTSKRTRFTAAQDGDVEKARTAPPASSAATMPNFRVEQDKRPVLNGRPSRNFGLPIGLFHDIFNTFEAEWTNQSLPNAGEGLYTTVKHLFKASADIYENASDRLRAIDPHLVDLLGFSFTVAEAPGVKSDGVLERRCGTSTAYLVIREVKNEIGTAQSDPYHQGSLAYRKYWAAQPQDTVRRKSYCPSIILAIAGPWLCVLGGIYHEKAVVQHLTDYLWIGDDKFGEENLCSIARLFSVLKSTVNTLQDYYDSLPTNLEESDSAAPQSLSGFPFICQYGNIKFTYETRLAEEYPNKILYKAKEDVSGRSLVIKFATRYNAEAHRYLADNNFAPTLRYSGTEDAIMTKYGGRFMIVMDFVDGQTIAGSVSKKHHDKISKSIDLLHSRGLVFGDLRAPNIMIQGEAVFLIDFDWCAGDGEGKYPVTLNQDGISWPHSVEPGGLMKKDHDRVMLLRLGS